jgi:hypothetical protein
MKESRFTEEEIAFALRPACRVAKERAAGPLTDYRATRTPGFE